MSLFGNREYNEFNDRFERKGNGLFGLAGKYEIIVDKVTGVHYLATIHYGNDTAYGVTPLLDENGNVMIRKPEAEQ